MKKYLVLGISSQLGGVETFIFNYIENMKAFSEEDRYEFVVFDKLPDFVKKSKLAGNKFHIVPSRIRNPIGYYKGLCEILSENNYDVLWYNACTLSDITLLKLAKKYRIPCRIIHSHNSKNMGGKLVGLLHTLHKAEIAKFANEFFACSGVAGEYMFPNRINRDCVKIIRNAIDVEKYDYNTLVRATKRRELGVEDKLLIGNVGRFHFQKNHDFIIDIFEKVLLQNRDSKLLLVGNGELKSKIIKKSEKLGIRNDIIFLENRSDINELLQAVDVFLMPSLFEGLPFALIEAQAADLPCVISDTISEEAIITENVCVLPLKEEPEMWAECIIRIASETYRKSQASLLEKKGFDISCNAKIIVEYLNEKY